MRRYILVSLVLLGAGAAGAKRLVPAGVAPVLHDGRRYEVPHFSNSCRQNGGCVVAYDTASNEQVWHRKVYCTKYDDNLEQDVQDVFITSLQVEGTRLRVANEKSRTFFLAMRDGSVSGADRGCDAGGCSSGRGLRTNAGAVLVAASVGALAILRLRRTRRPYVNVGDGRNSAPEVVAERSSWTRA